MLNKGVYQINIALRYVLSRFSPHLLFKLCSSGKAFYMIFEGGCGNFVTLHPQFVLLHLLGQARRPRNQCVFQFIPKMFSSVWLTSGFC